MADNNIEDLNYSLEDASENLANMLTELDRVNMGFSSITGAMAGKYAKNIKYLEKVIKLSSLATQKLSGNAHVMHSNLSKLKDALKDHDEDLGRHAEVIKESTKSIGDSLTGNLTKGIQEFLENTNMLVSDNMGKIEKLRYKQSMTAKKTVVDQTSIFSEIFEKLNNDILDSQYNLSKGIIGNKEFTAIKNSWESNFNRTSKDILSMAQDIAIDPRKSGVDQIADAINQFNGLQEIIRQQIESGLITPDVEKMFNNADKIINRHKDQMIAVQNEIGYKEEQIINATYEGMESLASGIERKFGGKLGKILFGFDPIMKTLRQRNDQILERIRKNGKRTAKDVQDQMKATAKAGAQMMGKVAANAPLILGVAVGAGIMMIANQMKGLFDQAISMAEQSWETLTGRMRENIDALRMSVSQGGAMAAALNMRFVDGMEVAWGDVAKSMAGIKEVQGDMVGLGTKQAKLITKLSVGLGASAEAAAGFYFLMTGAKDGSDKLAANAGAIVSQFSKVLGMSPEDIFKDMEESGEFLLKHSKSTGKEMVKTVMEAKKLGMKLSDVAKITDSMFDYETSIQNELEASLMLGRSIDLNRARQLMFNKQTDAGMKELASMMGTLEEFQDMNFTRQQSLAKVFGMSIPEYEKVLQNQKRMNSLTADQKRQLEAINKQREKMNDLNGEAYLNSEKTKLAQESMKQSWDDMTTDLGAQFIPIMIQYKGIMMNLMKTLLPALINGFTFLVEKIINPISNFFNSKDGQNMMKAINKEVGLIFNSMGALFDSVKKVIGELFGTSTQSIGGKATSTVETIGGAIRSIIDIMKWVVDHWKLVIGMIIASKVAPAAYGMFKAGKETFGKALGATAATPMYVNVVNANAIASAAKTNANAPVGDMTPDGAPPKSSAPVLNEGFKEEIGKDGKTRYRGADGRYTSRDKAFAPSPVDAPPVTSPGTIGDESTAKGKGKGKGKGRSKTPSSGQNMAAAGAFAALAAGIELFGPEDSKAVDAIQKGLMGISFALTLIEVGKLAVTAATWLWNAAMLANPITWIVLGVIALGAVILLLVVYWDDVKKALVKFWNNSLVPFINWLWKGLGMIASIQPWDLMILGLQVVLKGVSALLDMLSGIPGLGGLSSWAGSVDSLTESLNALKVSTYIGSGDLVGPLPMAARGGLFSSPTAAIIGEAGPEIVIPAKPASEIMSGNDYTPYDKLGIKGGGSNSDLKNEINRLSDTVNQLSSAIQNMGIYMNGQKVGGVIARSTLSPKLG